MNTETKCIYSTPETTQTIAKPVKTKKKPNGVAAALSIIPGLGHLYKGEILSGMFLFMLTTAGYICLLLPGVLLHVLVIYDGSINRD